MQNINFQEDYSSQLPALRMLINSGYTFLSNDEAMALRYDKSSNVLLEPILKEQLAKFNEIRVSSSHTEKFTQSNIDEAVLRLKEIPFEQGYIAATQYIYELLTLGTTLDQTIQGNKREYTLKFIDWDHLENNVFHIVEEYNVLQTDGKRELRPDLVLFVNGIPLGIIENKREDLKEPIRQAISQHLRNQQEDRIRGLYVYAQILISCAVGYAKYATNGTPEEFWNTWREEFIAPTEIEQVKNKKVPAETIRKIVKPRQNTDYFSKEKAEFIYQLFEDEFTLTEQDVLLYAVANPKRLLDLTRNFILYDNGIKKIARYQQYVAVKKALNQIKTIENGRRQGGVIWHTQGSGKSLTMALLAEAIAREESIKNPKIILVTDRTDLDKQITGTFRNIGLEVLNARTGAHLIEILESNTDAVVTTIINKFETAVKGIKQPLESQNIFVLVDEGHRTQHGTFNINMQKTMPNACFIAFTGTPLFKKDKSTAEKFGGMIDTYTVNDAVGDKAVLPLLYEGRYAKQNVNKDVIDNYFNMVSENLSDYEKADLKKKFSASSQIADADQNIYAIAWDISQHFVQNFQGRTPFKGQLVCSSKKTAVKYYNYLKQIGKVSCELVISPPDDREGEETAYGKTDEKVKSFWNRMMDQHGNSTRYEENIIAQFKNEPHPEIIIVVDKLLTGFDAPRNTVLYLTRKLRNHTLLQAIARVNRLYPDKDYGYIVDYAGVVEELDDALLTYSDLEEFDEKDLVGTLTNIKTEIEKLDPAHQEVLSIFKTIKNTRDLEEYQQVLRDQDVRENFYKRLADFARILKVALSSMDFHKTTPEKKINKYKSDLKFFMNLRTAVAQRFSDKVDYKKYEGQIQQLIDQHISTEGIEILTDLVDIFDEEAFQQELQKTVGNAAKADKIATRTAKHINERMDEDPAFYKKFSQLIEATISEFYSKRISDLDYLNRMNEIRKNVLSKTDSTIPDEIKNHPSASAFYGIVYTFYEEKGIETDGLQEILVEASLKINEIIENKKVVNWHQNSDVIKKMSLEIGDFIYDEVREKIGLDMKWSEVDKLTEQMISVAKTRG